MYVSVQRDYKVENVLKLKKTPAFTYICVYSAIFGVHFLIFLLPVRNTSNIRLKLFHLAVLKSLGLKACN